MMKVIVTTHGDFCSGLVDAAHMLIGEVEGLTYASLKSGMGAEEYEEILLKQIGEVNDQNQCLIFVDILSGTPFNISSKLSFNNPNIVVFYGVNLPILIEALLTRNGTNVSGLVAGLVASGKDTMGIGQF